MSRCPQCGSFPGGSGPDRQSGAVAAGAPNRAGEAWRPPRERKLGKALFALLVLAVLVGVVAAVMPESTQPGEDDAGSSGEFTAPEPDPDDDDEQQPEPEPEPEPEPDPEPEPEPEPEPRSYRFEGEGDNVTQNFSTQYRLLRFGFRHQETGFFTVILHDETGQEQQTLVDELGRYEGTRYFNPPAGEYRLEVRAEGPWRIELDQPRPEEGEEPPIEWEDEADHASDAMHLESGPAAFNLSHQATGSFTVRLFDEHGELIETPVDTWGGHSGSYNVTIPQEGLYVLDIQADGPWRVEVSQ